jgi:hypothetical protein
LQKKLQGYQQKDQSTIGKNLINQVLLRVEQAFAKIKTSINKRVVVSAVAAASSSLTPTSTQKSDKILIHAKIIQTNGDRAANDQNELDVKSKISKYLN